jgi:hypothetical protein
MTRTRLVLLVLFGLSLAASLALLDCGSPDVLPDAGSADTGVDTSCALDSGGTGTLCGNACVDVTSDPANCSACNKPCQAGQTCVSKQCTDVAGALAGLRWELPCSGAGSAPVNCATRYDAGLAVVRTATIQGVPGTTYSVTLRFRGIVEEKTYSGATTGGAIGAGPDGGTNSNLFVVGGTPSGDTWNIYALGISDPATTYYLNSGASGTDRVFLLDYRASLPMKAGATVTLTANSVEGLETRNIGSDGNPVIVSDIPPAPNPYDGQFVQMDVESVVARY